MNRLISVISLIYALLILLRTNREAYVYHTVSTIVRNFVVALADPAVLPLLCTEHSI